VRFLPYAASAWLFLAGLYGIVTSKNFIHLISCLWVAQTSTYVLLLSVGFRTGATAPIFADIPMGTPVVDPVVQSLVLTDVVVAVVVRWAG
jgi:multicomponent Na+:H+ antiporter subunit C